MKRINILAVLVFLLSGNIYNAAAQVLTEKQVDSVVAKTLKAFDVPGIAVAIVKDGKVVLSKGYGLRSLKTKEPVTETTFFGIASNSKAFTAAGLGMLVDEGKLKWDDKVISILPDFKMYDPFVTNEFTVRDLLTHRSGLGLGAGDLMLWPDSTLVTKNELIHNLRYLKPVSSFRSKWDYDNLLYIVAGEVLAKVSGMSWEDFIEKRIMRPIGMANSAASYPRLADNRNSIDAHAPINDIVTVIGKDFTPMGNAAGGIWSNVAEMSKWAIMQMNDGKYDQGKELFSKTVHDEMWTPQTIMRSRSSAYNTHFTSYGLGWILSDASGYFHVEHTGGLGGIVTQVTLVPELKLGIIVFTNQQAGYAFRAITNAIKDGYFGLKKRDWITNYSAADKSNLAEAKKITDKLWADIATETKKNTKKPDLNNYTGAFTDEWFGQINLTQRNGKFWFQALKSPKLRGELHFYKDNTFIVKWEDRSMDADAFAKFTIGTDGKATGLTMEAISPLTDFSYDFQDLNFTRTNRTK